MPPSLGRPLIPLVALLAGVLVAVAGACGDDDRPDPAPTMPASTVTTAAATSPAATATTEPDGDEDGVPDSADECAADAEDARWSAGDDGCPDGIAELAELAVQDIGEFWPDVVIGLQGAYAPPAGIVGYDGPVTTGCGEAVPDNALYCPVDNSIYFDVLFLDRQLAEVGDFGPVFIIAHEWGHLVQGNLGILADPLRFSIQNELQADCLAGVYARDAQDRGLLEEGDLDEAVQSLIFAGDPESTPWYAPGAHGSAEQRISAFSAGYNTGIDSCLEV